MSLEWFLIIFLVWMRTCNGGGDSNFICGYDKNCFQVLGSDDGHITYPKVASGDGNSAKKSSNMSDYFNTVFHSTISNVVDLDKAVKMARRVSKRPEDCEVYDLQKLLEDVPISKMCYHQPVMKLPEIDLEGATSTPAPVVNHKPTNCASKSSDMKMQHQTETPILKNSCFNPVKSCGGSLHLNLKKEASA